MNWHDDPEQELPCPKCGHAWKAHDGRNGGQHCNYREYGRDCRCREMNPRIKREDDQAGAMWNAFMGRDNSGR